MTSPIARPPLDQLVYRLYDRPLHPELFETLAIRTVERDGFTVSARITPAGHVLVWTRGTTHLSEVTATSDQMLPEQGQRLAYRFQGECRGRCRIANDVDYQVNLQTERLEPEVFLHVHEELANDGARRGLLFHFRPNSRLGLTPIGFVSVELLPTGLAVNTFHTFPDEFAIIKTQSLIEPC